VSLGDLPSEFVGTSTTIAVAGSAATPPIPVTVQALWRRLVVERESFWTAVYPQFRDRALTRDDLRLLITEGLRETHGFYRALIALFNMPGDDYKRFMNFLDSHDCKVPPKDYRTGRRTERLRGPDDGPRKHLSAS